MLTTRSCDEGRPSCRRCLQIKKPCPGYPLFIELHIREDESEDVPLHGSSQSVPILTRHSSTLSSDYLPADYESAPSLLPPFVLTDSQLSEFAPPETSPELAHLHVPRESNPIEVKHELQQIQRSLLAESVRLQRSITPPPKYDVQHQATCFFLHLFSFQAIRLYGVPVFDFLPDMLAKTSPTHAIHQAVTAVSRMTLADRYSGRDARLQTSREYAKALHTMSRTVVVVDEAMKDETVTAVWLLGLYEVRYPDDASLKANINRQSARFCRTIVKTISLAN